MPFSDVAEQEYGYNAILYMEKINLMNGDQDGKFPPTLQLPEESFAKLQPGFWRMGKSRRK